MFIVKYLFKADPPKVNGIYSQPNKWYWVKYWTFRLMLWLRKRQQHKQVTGQNVGMGRKSRNSPEEMDTAQVLPKEHPLVSHIWSCRNAYVLYLDHCYCTFSVCFFYVTSHRLKGYLLSVRVVTGDYSFQGFDFSICIMTAQETYQTT